MGMGNRKGRKGKEEEGGKEMEGGFNQLKNFGMAPLCGVVNYTYNAHWSQSNTSTSHSQPIADPLLVATRLHSLEQKGWKAVGHF